MKLNEESLRDLVGSLVFVSLHDGTKLKGIAKNIAGGVLELHSLTNRHYIDVKDIQRATVAKETKEPQKAVKGDIKRAF